MSKDKVPTTSKKLVRADKALIEDAIFNGIGHELSDARILSTDSKVMWIGNTLVVAVDFAYEHSKKAK